MNTSHPLINESVLDNLSELIVYQDTNLIVQWANKAAGDSINKNKSELLGKHCFELWHQRTEPCVDCPVVKTIKTEKPQQGEITTPDSRVWNIRANPIKDENGKLIGIIEFAMDMTERKKWEDSLKASEELYRDLYENSIIGFFRTRIEDGVFIMANDATVKFFGFKNQDEFIGRHSVADYYSKKERKKLLKIFKSHGEVSGYELKMTLPDGQEKHVLLSGKAFFEKGYLQGTVIDISERKKAEKALKDSEEQYRNLYETSLVSHWRTRIEDGIILKANMAAARAAGFNSPEELVGKYSILDAYPEEERKKLLKELFKNGEVSGFEIAAITPKGIKKQLLISAKIFPDKGYIEGAVIDISHLKKVEELLRTSEAEYRNLVENITDGMAIADLDENLTFANSTACQIFGYSREELIGINLRQLVVLKDFESISKGTFRRKNGESDKYEVAIIRKDGQIRQVQLSASPNYDENHNVIGCVGIFSDITEVKKAEENRKKLENQLERAQRMESIGILAGGVAHDLNNILGPLVAYPEMILAKLDDDSPVRRQIEMMGNCARDAAEIIQDLLTLARRGRYEMHPTDLNDVIESYLFSAHVSSLKEKNPDVLFETKLDKTIPLIPGSPTHLMKVLMNLVVNAIDAMPNGGTLTVETSLSDLKNIPGSNCEAGQGNYVQLSVRDTGIGIDEKNIKRIFEPYFSKKEMGSSGSGLGLSVVYGILKDHNGYYEIDSKPHQGTEFILHFPATKEKAIKANDEKQDYSGNERVLIVDDSEVQRQIAFDILSNQGYRVDSAPNGREAVKIIAEKSYELIVLDMIMEKDFDGLDTFMEIIKIHPQQKAIIVSGFSATGRVNKMNELGAGIYIRKPYTAAKLAKAVREELDKKSIPLVS